MEPMPSRQAKDHVFVDMFNQPKYCLELFQAIHPEATDITESDISNITLSHVLVDKPYNDLGFTVKDKRIILVEAQSEWSYNILLRLLMYFVETLRDYLDSMDLDVHSPGKLAVPEPEFYVIYTGNRDVPPVISFKEVFGWANLDLIARVINSENENDIIGQYIIFAHVFDAQVKKYGRVKKAIEETLRICRDRGVLKEYLDAHGKEVLTVMLSMFDQERSIRLYGDRREKEGAIRTLADLVEEGTLSEEKAAEKMGMTVDEFNNAVEQLKAPV